MKPFTRRIILPALLLFTLASHASPKLVTPFFNTSRLIVSLKTQPVEPKSAKICACQLLDVKSNNEDLQNLVIFAEKTNNGDLTNAQEATMQVLHKERKNMKTFYTKITVKHEIIIATDCASLYLQLKGQYDNLKFFEMVDADIRLAINQ